MPMFTAQFFLPTHHELNPDEQSQLTELLQDIYHEPCCDYQELSDFSHSLSQLLTLLDYIYGLNRLTLGLFKRFHNTISTLSLSHSEETIHHVLKSTKRSIEISLPIIKARHANIDADKLNCLTVDLCIAGACSNIEQALSYFHKDSLALYLEHAKAIFLMQLTQEFLHNNHLLDYMGNDIHAANFLYNQCAKKYGLSQKEDPLIGHFPLSIISRYWHFIDTRFTACHFLPYCYQSFPKPPNLSISDKSSFDALDDFFALFNQKNSRENYLYLYQEHYINDLEINLIPKINFHTHYSCLLTIFLEKAGYIIDATFCIDGVMYLHIGDNVLARIDNQNAQLLTEKEQYSLADYVFSHPKYSLTNTQLMLLIRQLPLKKMGYYITCLIKADKAEYLRNLFIIKPHILIHSKTWLPHLAIGFNATDILSLLDRLDIDLQFPNSEGIMPAHVAADYGHLAAIDRLYTLRADLGIQDKNGLTLAHYAARQGHVAILYQLKELGLDLNRVDNYGRTPAEYAIHYGQDDILRQYPDLGMTFDVMDKAPPEPGFLINFLSIFTFFKSCNTTQNRISQYDDHPTFP